MSWHIIFMYRKTTNFPEISLKLHYTLQILTESKHHIIPGVSHSELQIKPLRFQAFVVILHWEQNRNKLATHCGVRCSGFNLKCSRSACFIHNKQTIFLLGLTETTPQWHLKI